MTMLLLALACTKQAATTSTVPTTTPTVTLTDTATTTTTTPTTPTTDTTVTDTTTPTTLTDSGFTLPAGLHGTVPPVNLLAPTFAGVTSRDGTPKVQADLIGQPTVMWFYPAAFTGG